MRAIDVAATQRGGGGENDVMPERNFQKLPSAFSGYSCFNFQACSLWMSFGVYVTGVLFQTAAFVSFLLISHGYCIMCESLSLNERRSTATLACVFYLTLVGYKACVPYFSVLLLLNYFISFYIIFHHISQDLAPNFSVMPTTKCKGERLVPRIYSIEMDAATFKEFSSYEWHIGVEANEESKVVTNAFAMKVGVEEKGE